MVEISLSGSGEGPGWVTAGATRHTPKGKVKNAWDKVGNSFDAQVASVLGRLGVPTRDEINAVNRRLDRLEKAQGKKTAPVRKRRVTRKPTVRKTTAARRKKTPR